jgi:ribosomal protein L40E
VKCRACESQRLRQLSPIADEEGVIRLVCEDCGASHSNVYIMVPSDELRRLVLASLQLQQLKRDAVQVRG